MRDGFIKVAAVTPDIRVADCEYNAEQICKKMKEAAALGSKIIVFPELCITGYTCETHWIRSEKKAVKSMHWSLSDFRGNGKESFTMLQRRSAMADCWDWCRKRIFRIILSFMKCVILSRQTKN